MRLNELPKWAVPAACSVVAFGAGAAAGILFTKNRRAKLVVIETEDDGQLKFDFNSNELDRELNKATYTIRKMRDECENIVSAVRDLAILKDIPVGPSRENHPSNVRPDPKNIVVVPREEPEGEVVHIFTEPAVDENWDYEVELRHRDPRYPYIIHRDEFFNDEMGYGAAGDQRTFTWYAADQVLADEKDIPIYDPQKRVGTLEFGHGSGDPNIVYVRNVKEEEEYEIVLDDGAFQTVVLGERVEGSMEHQDIKHSRAPAKFRRED